MADDKKSKMGDIAKTVGAGLVGAAAGASAALLADKRNRDKIQKTLESMKKKGQKKIDEMHDRMQEQVENMKEKTDEYEDDLKKKAKDIKAKGKEVSDKSHGK